jgi:hypothetical protein
VVSRVCPLISSPGRLIRNRDTIAAYSGNCIQ